jgi:pilus assembly protein Flp/PilA
MRVIDQILGLLRDERGATAIEYGLIASMIVIAMVASLNNFANSTIDMWTRVSTTMEEAR